MWIQAYAVAAGDRELLRAEARRAGDLRVAAGWPSPPPDCTAVLVIARQLDGAACRRLRRLRDRGIALPIVLATSMSADNLLHLAAVTVDLVVDIDEGADCWLKAVRAVARDPHVAERRQLLLRIRNASHLSGLLQKAALQLLSAVPPIRSVKALALATGCSTSTLRVHFARLGTGWRLEDLVDWFVLVHYGWLDRAAFPAASDESPPPTERTLQAMAIRLLNSNRTSEGRPDLADHPIVERLLEPKQSSSA